MCSSDLTIPLTQDVGRFMQLIPFITPRGATPLFDSVERAAHLVQRGHNSRKMVVVISDGEDTSSSVTLLELERLLTEADVHLYVIQLWAGSVSDDRFALRKSAEETGGSFFSDIAPKRLPEVISRLDVHWQYVIAFEPPENTHVRSHSIQVRMAGEAKVKNLQIFYRHAYTEPLSGSVN